MSTKTIVGTDTTGQVNRLKISTNGEIFSKMIVDGTPASINSHNELRTNNVDANPKLQYLLTGRSFVYTATRTLTSSSAASIARFDWTATSSTWLLYSVIVRLEPSTGGSGTTYFDLLSNPGGTAGTALSAVNMNVSSSNISLVTATVPSVAFTTTTNIIQSGPGTPSTTTVLDTNIALNGSSQLGCIFYPPAGNTSMSTFWFFYAYEYSGVKS